MRCSRCNHQLASHGSLSAKCYVGSCRCPAYEYRARTGPRASELNLPKAAQNVFPLKPVRA